MPRDPVIDVLHGLSWEVLCPDLFLLDDGVLHLLFVLLDEIVDILVGEFHLDDEVGSLRDQEGGDFAQEVVIVNHTQPLQIDQELLLGVFLGNEVVAGLEGGVEVEVPEVFELEEFF